MSAEDNKQAAKDGYDAFSQGDAEGAMANISDSAEWVVSGDSAVSGTHNGKHEIGALWGQLAEKGFQTDPKEFLADGDKVVVMATNTVAGETTDVVDVLTYSDGQLVRFQGYGGEEVLNRVFPQ